MKLEKRFRLKQESVVTGPANGLGAVKKTAGQCVSYVRIMIECGRNRINGGAMKLMDSRMVRQESEFGICGIVM